MAKCTGVRCPMQYGYKVEECNHTDCPYRTEPITNADRIRAMSDEELARKLVNASYRYDWKQDEDYWYFPNGTTKTNYKPKAIEAWLEWLKQPAEE